MNVVGTIKVKAPQAGSVTTDPVNLSVRACIENGVITGLFIEPNQCINVVPSPGGVTTFVSYER